MGSLMLQLGQCGCQIGAKINQRLSNSYYCTRNRNPNKQHTIMIDTQPKVLKPFVQKTPTWLDPSNIKYFQHGRGNNWSYGYLQELPQQPINDQSLNSLNPKIKQFSHQIPNKSLLSLYLRQNKQICEFVLERTRKQLETVDCATCINVLCSLGGGTGSGLGTKIIQLLSDQFMMDLHSHVVLPNKCGQTPLQVYNCALSLASIQEFSTALFTYQNDHMIDMFGEDGSLDQINECIADNISSLIKINDIPKYDRFYNDLVSECIVGSHLNYLNLFHSANKNWDLSFQQLFRNLKTFNQNDSFVPEQQAKRGKCLASNMLLTGNQQCQYENRYDKKMRSLLNPLPDSFMNYEKAYSTVKKPGNQNCRITLINNSSNILRYLNYLLESGKKKYEAKAYLWHYQYANILQSFDKIQQTVDQYTYYSFK